MFLVRYTVVSHLGWHDYYIFTKIEEAHSIHLKGLTNFAIHPYTVLVKHILDLHQDSTLKTVPILAIGGSVL